MDATSWRQARANSHPHEIAFPPIGVAVRPPRGSGISHASLLLTHTLAPPFAAMGSMRLPAPSVAVVPLIGLCLVASACQGVPADPPTTRTYYVAAEEVEWDLRAGRPQPHHGRRLERRPAPLRDRRRHARGPPGAEGDLSRVHRLHLYHAEAAARRVGTPRHHGAAAARGRGRHDPGGVPQPGHLPGQHAPARRVLPEGLRGRPLRRRHGRRGATRRRRPPRGRGTPTSGPSRSGRAPRTTRAAPPSGCTTPTPARWATSTPA